MWFITAKWADVEKQVDSENLYTCTQVADLIKLGIFFNQKKPRKCHLFSSLEQLKLCCCFLSWF